MCKTSCNDLNQDGNYRNLRATGIIRQWGHKLKFAQSILKMITKSEKIRY